MRILAGLCMLALPACTPMERPAATPAAPMVEAWLTLPDQSQLLAQQPSLALEVGDSGPAAIKVDPAQRYQEMVGYGAAITDASAYLIQKRMTAAQRKALLAELFGPTGIGLSFTRITIGASDFSRTHYSYDDRPKGETDPELAHFSIAPARTEVLPTVRAARAINPKLALMVSPWSPPGWMKTTDSLVTGTLREDAYRPFAAYLRRTVQDFAAEVGAVDYLSIQNEPDFEPDSYPGMRLSAAQRATSAPVRSPCWAPNSPASVSPRASSTGTIIGTCPSSRSACSPILKPRAMSPVSPGTATRATSPRRARCATGIPRRTCSSPNARAANGPRPGPTAGPGRSARW